MNSFQLLQSTRRALLLGCAAIFLAGPAFSQSAPKVKFQTTLGDFVVEVYPDKAPKTVENFLQYVKDKHYDGTVFHRVIANFMIQGGGFSVDLNQKSTRAAIPLEANNGLKNDTGTIAMARTANPNSATAQFFINTVDNAMLNAPQPDGYGYAVFGKIVSGMDVILKIKSTPTGSGGPFRSDVPQTPIIINSATLVK
jgi:cyclophilin family peptidyl-prolyl cis-trans isomerase